MLFSNISNIIKACEAYERVVKLANKKTQQNKETLLNGLLGTIGIAEINAKRFLDQFKQFDVYNDGDVYAEIPLRILNRIVSRNNFSVLAQYKKNKEDYVLIKFVPGTKYPIVLIEPTETIQEGERLGELRNIYAVFEHLKKILDLKDNKGKPLFVMPLNENPTLGSKFKEVEKEFIKLEKAINNLENKKKKTEDDYFKLKNLKNKRDILLKRKQKIEEERKTTNLFLVPKADKIFIDFIDMIIENENENFSPDIVSAALDLKMYFSRSSSGQKLLANAFMLYNDDAKATKILESIDSGKVPDFNPQEEKETQEVKAVLNQLRDEEQRDDESDKKALHTNFTIPTETENYIKHLIDKQNRTEAEDNLIRISRTYGLDKTKEKLLRIERQDFRIPSTKSMYIDTAFIDVNNLADQVRKQILAKSKGLSIIETENNYRKALTDQIRKRMVEETERSQKLGQLRYESFAENRKLFPSMGELAPSLDLEEYFDDPQIIKDFIGDKNEPSAYRVQRQSSIIESQIEAFNSNIDYERIKKLTDLETIITENRFGDISDLSMFSDEVNKKAFIDWLSKPEEQASLDYKVKILKSIIEKEKDNAKNISKIMKLLELRKMIDPASPMFYISQIQQKIEQALRITTLANYLKEDLSFSIRLPKVSPENVGLDFSKYDREKTVEQDYVSNRPEKFYLYEKELGKQKEIVKINESYVYLMGAEKYNLIKQLLSEISEKYKDIFKPLVGKKILQNEKLSTLIMYSKLVSHYLGLPFVFENKYRTKLKSRFVNEIDFQLSNINDFEQKLNNRQILESDRNNVFKLDPKKVYNDNIIIPRVLKSWIDAVLLLGYAEMKPARGNESKEKYALIEERAEEIKLETEEEYIMLYIDEHTPIAEEKAKKIRKVKGNVEANAFLEAELEEIQLLAEQYGKKAGEEAYKAYLEQQKPQYESVFETIQDLSLEEEIALDEKDNFWMRFNELGTAFSEHMQDLEKSGYQYNVAFNDPITATMDLERPRIEGVVSGQSAMQGGSSVYKPIKALDTIQYFPESWNPQITLYATDTIPLTNEDGSLVVDANGTPIEKIEYDLDDDGYKITIGTYSLFDEDFWREVVTLPFKYKKLIENEVLNTVKENTLFTELDDPALILNTLVDLSKSELDVENWLKEEYEKILKTKGIEEADKWYARQTKKQFSGGNYRREYDLQSEGGIIKPLSFIDVFGTSYDTLVNEKNNIEIIEEKSLKNKINQPKDKLFKAVASDVDKKKHKALKEKIRNLKNKNISDSEKQRQHELLLKEINELMDRAIELDAFTGQEPDKTVNLATKKLDEINEKYKKIALAKLPEAITKGLLRHVIKNSSVLQYLVVDNSEHRMFLYNQIKNFVTLWLDQNQNETEFIKNLNKLLGESKTFTYVEKLFIFSLKDIFTKFQEAYPNIVDNEEFKNKSLPNEFLPLRNYLSGEEDGQTSKGFVKNIEAELDTRRLLLYLTSPQTKDEGIDISVNFNEEFGKVVISNAANETYLLDDMLKDFVKKQIDNMESSDKEYIKEDIEKLPIDLTDSFFTEIMSGGSLHDQFSGLSANNSLFLAEKNNSYIQFLQKQNVQPEVLQKQFSAEDISGKFRFFILERITEFVDDYMINHGKVHLSILHDKRKWESTFATKEKEDVVSEHIYTLVSPFAERFENISKMKLKRKISDIAQVRRIGVLVPPKMEEFINMVINEVYKFDSTIYEQFKKAVDVFMEKVQKDEIEPPIDNHLANIKQVIFNTLSANKEIKIRDLITIKLPQLINDMREQGNYDESEIQLFQAPSVMYEHLVDQYVDNRVDELFAEMSINQDAQSYEFSKNSENIINLIIKLLPAEELDRNKLSGSSLYNLIKQVVETHSFADWNTRPKFGYGSKSALRTIKEKRSFIDNQETGKQMLDKFLQNKIESSITEIVRLFYWAEVGLAKTLESRAKKYKTDSSGIPLQEYQAVWIHDSLQKFIGEVKTVTDVDEKGEEIKLFDVSGRSSREMYNLLRGLNISNGSPQFKKLFEYMQAKAIRLRGKFTSLVDKHDKELFAQIKSMVLEKFDEKTLQSFGFTDNVLNDYIAAALENPESATRVSQEGRKYNQLVREIKSKNPKRFSLESYDLVKVFGTRSSSYIITVLSKLITPDVFAIVSELSASNCTSVEDVSKSTLLSESVKEDILSNYDNEGITRLLQLNDLKAMSQKYNPASRNYYVRIKASQLGNIQFKKVNAPLETISDQTSWHRKQVHVPIFDLSWKKRDVAVTDEKGKPYFSKKEDGTEVDFDKKLGMKAFLVEDGNLNPKLGDDKDTDFLFEAMTEWQSGISTSVLDKFDTKNFLQNFFYTSNNIDEMYRASIMSEDNLLNLYKLLDEAVNKGAVLTNMSPEREKALKSNKQRGIDLLDRRMLEIESPPQFSVPEDMLPEGIPQFGKQQALDSEPTVPADIGDVGGIDTLDEGILPDESEIPTDEDIDKIKEHENMTEDLETGSVGVESPVPEMKKDEFLPGTRVMHKKWGFGKVLSRNNEETLVIKFDSGEKKTLNQKFLLKEKDVVPSFKQESPSDESDE